MDQARVHEIRIHEWASDADAFALHEPLARLLCPDEWHTTPCEVPWGLTHDEDEDGVVLVLGVCATGNKAREVADRVRGFIGEQHPVALTEGDPERFEELLEQYHIERGLPPPPQSSVNGS